MHDVLAHRISLLSMHAGALEFRPHAPPDEIARAAGVVRASAHQALQDMREVIGVLRDDPKDGDPERPQPTLADLPSRSTSPARPACTSAPSAASRISPRSRPALAATPTESSKKGSPTRKHAQGAAVHVTLDGPPVQG